MDRQATFLLALGLLIAAAAVVSATGWILFARDRRADRDAQPAPRAAAENHEIGNVSPRTDPRSSDA